MSLANTSRATMRRLLGAPRLRINTPSRRGLATHEPQVTWAEYRSGKKTLNEWVDANRHIVAGSFFAFYVSIAAWNLRPGKKRKKTETEAQAEADVAGATTTEMTAPAAEGAQ